jgi:hypothetical protein
MKDLRKCTECGKPVASGNTMVSYAARKMGYCKRCYLDFYPKRPMWKLPAARHGSQKVFTPSERKYIERSQFEYMEIFLWEPEFYYEWLDAFYG